MVLSLDRTILFPAVSLATAPDPSSILIGRFESRLASDWSAVPIIDVTIGSIKGRESIKWRNCFQRTRTDAFL